MQKNAVANSIQHNIPRAIILTAQADVFNEACAYLVEQREETHPKGTIYQVGTFTDSSVAWEVVVVDVAIGNNSVAMETERAINHFQPSIMLFVGLAGGLKDVSIGDVVISTKVYGYESGKEGARSFEPRPNVGRSSYGLEQRAKAEARKKDWLKRLKDSISPEPHAKIGAIASGEKRIEAINSQTGFLLKSNYGDALAVEMEGYGFLEGVHANHTTEAIIIRGISNLITDNNIMEVSGSALVAAQHACAFTFELLSKLSNQKTNITKSKSVVNLKGTKKRNNKNSGLSQQQISVIEDTRVDEFKIITINNLYSVLTGQPNAVLFLGGGASVKSGIPLSEGLVEKAAKWEYCQSKGLEFDDPSVKRSDWLQSLRNNTWYNHKSLEENYSSAIRYLLRPRDNRKRFFIQMLHTNVPASQGYERLLELMSLKTITTIITTNIDSVLRDLCRARSRIHHIDVVDNPTNYKELTTSPRFPVLIYLYGSLESYIDRFETEQEPKVDTELVNRLIPILRDHPLIVIGYNGAEEAIMRHLLTEQMIAADYYPHGIYWCSLNYETPSDLHPLVREFANLIQGNFQVVPIEGFDSLMEQLSILHQNRHLPSTPTPQQFYSPSPAPTFDMQLISVDFDNEIDWISLQSRLINYCSVMEIAVPRVVNREWLIELLCQHDLAIKTESKLIQPTNAGYLLFGRNSHERIPSSKVLLRVIGEEQWIEGNLWNQLALLTDALAEFNKPFRLKGEKSETVYPYPPLALKEVLVNALVHRDYNDKKNVVVDIEADHIRITNPGGLVDEVLRQTEGTSILTQIEQGKKGIKGYRNPVIADLFYSSGDMDKAGSGLADVHQLVTNNGGKVIFEPINNNTAFEVIIDSRPEAVDKQTRTAPTVVATRYASNILEVLELPDKVWFAPTIYKRIKDVWAATNAEWLPPFIPFEGKLYTFFSLKDYANPLRELVDVEDMSWITTKQFYSDEMGQQDEDAERKLVWLLNECLYRHLNHCGLYVDKIRKRAYFPRTEQGNRSISYQARLRRSSRTVTKQIISHTTQKVRYWEHQSFSFMFERFANTWALQILPGYVFTRDGYKNLLSGDRVNILSTRRASRDYNNKVHTDLVFWSWVLSEGMQSSFAIQMTGKQQTQKQLPTYSETKVNRIRKKKNQKLNNEHNNSPRVIIKSSLPTLTIHNLELVEDEEESLMDEKRRAELIELEEEIASLIENNEFEDVFEDEIED